MSKVSFDKNKFIEYAKRGTSLVLLPVTLTLASCNSEETTYKEDAPTTSITEFTKETTTTTNQQTNSETTTKQEETTKTPYSNITKVVDNDEFPIYSGTDESGFNYLITEDSQRISNAYDYYELDPKSKTIKTYHKTSQNSDLKPWFDLYSYDGELLLHNLSYTTFNIIPDTDLVLYKFEETDNYGILQMKTDHCERIIHSAFTNVTTYQPKGTTESEDKYIIGTNEQEEIFIYDTNLGLVSTGNMSIEEACDIAEEAHTAKQETKPQKH